MTSIIKSAKIFIFLAVLLIARNTLAQTSTAVPNPPVNEPRTNTTRILEEQQLKINDKNGNSLTKEERKQINEEEKRILEAIKPNPDDKAKYKKFLSHGTSGIFRLFPDFDCQQTYVIIAGGKCENYIPDSSAYSFRQKNYVTDMELFDIQFKDDQLITKGYLSQGILTALGDVPIENVSLDHEGIKYLSFFAPATQNDDARKQYAEIESGKTSGSYTYAKSVKATLNTTYALRVIAYRIPREITKIVYSNKKEDKENVPDNRLPRLMFYDLKRNDITVVFRIVRQDEDGSITIVWKELHNQDAPEVALAPDEKLASLGFSK